MATKAQKKAITEAAAVIEALDEVGVPTYTIRADSRFGMICMIAIARAAGEYGLDAETRGVADQAVRDFELYEEANR
jgi:hypothetical protein